MPQKICSVCISYLKHACIFRQQAINNVKSLKTAKELSDGTIVGIKIDQPQPQAYEKFFKSNMSITTPSSGNVASNDFESLKQQLDLFFGDSNFDEDDEDDEDDDDDNGDDDDDVDDETLNGISTAAGVRAEAVKMAIHNFFNYTEKPFEEDDLTEGIGISEPDDHKERKCYACKRRFMLTDSYDEHMKDCVQTKLFSFITDCHQLAIIKKHKAISAQEFIRRMIFAVKGIVKALAMCYKDLSPPIRSQTAPPPQSQAKSQNLLLPPMNNALNRPTTTTTTTEQASIIKREKHLPKQLFNVIDTTTAATNAGPPPKLTARPPVQVIRSHPIAAVQSPTTSIVAPLLNANFPKIPNFVAKCPQCKQRFDSIQALEMHNQHHHNISVPDLVVAPPPPHQMNGSMVAPKVTAEPRNELLELLRSQDYANDGIIDVFRLHRK